MQNFYVYRYIDEKTKEIVYIGKTSQLFVTNRLDQHKTDNVGIWASQTPHYIEFVEVPREEDMSYLESYLIRKIRPRLNIVLMAHTAPPFELQLDENKWINLDKYLSDKEKAKNSQSTIFANNVLLIQESNTLFQQTINNIVLAMSNVDKNFIKKICLMNDLYLPTCNVSQDIILKTFGNIEETCNRLVSYTTDSRIAGTITDIRKVGIFDRYEIGEDTVTFYFNPYVRKIMEVLM